MGESEVRGAILALMATIIYYLGFIVFKVAAKRMPPLRCTQPIRGGGYAVTSWLWWSGLVIVLAGVATQIKALTLLPLSIAQPIFAVSLVFILFYAVVFFRERLSGREWASVALFGLATIMIGVSNGRREVLTTYVAGPGTLATVVAPAVLIAIAVFAGCDLRAFGRHARPLSGIAYGFGAGVSLGVSELCIKGVATIYTEHGIKAAAYTTPYPYLVVGMAVLGLAQLLVGLQRCRIAIVVSVLTVTAKTLLAILGPLLFKEPWPADRLLLALRLGAFGLTFIALVMFPRHDAFDEAPGTLPVPARERA